jgi:plastocyanin
MTIARAISLVTCALLAGTGTPALGAGTVVEGTVTAERPWPKPAPVKITKDATVCGAEQPSEALRVTSDGELQNVVVWLRPATPATPEPPPPPPGRATIDQVGCRYKPHVQAAAVGSELTLVNSDGVLHNVHGTLGAVTVFNLAMPIKGQKLPIKLTRPGVVRLQCDAGHTWMNAWIHVFRETTFAVTDEHGRFTIPGVLPGEYTIEYWHEPRAGQGPEIRKTARLVVAGKPVHADAQLKM